MSRPTLNAVPPYTLVESPRELAPIYAALGRVDEVTLDTEADNLYHYRTRVCLMQMNLAGEIFLVDLLSCAPPADFWQILAGKHLVMHGSDFDLRLLQDLCGFRARSLFDTMLAAQLLNLPRIGLSSLLEQHFGLVLDKDSQKANWSRRPLTKKLLDYAALDVHHLPALRDLLQAELSRLGRTEWLRQKCAEQIAAGAIGFPTRDAHAWRIGKSERLGPRGKAVLYDLWHWREAAAQRLDVPPFKVVNNELLLELSHEGDQQEPAETLHQLDLGRRQPLLPSLIEAYRAGLARDPTSLPRRARGDGEYAPLTADEVARQEKIRAGRDVVARQHGLDPTLIATRSQLADLGRDPSRLDALLLPFQADLLRPVVAELIPAAPEQAPAPETPES